MQETSKSIIRRSYDKRYATRWLTGFGIDIGAGGDTIGNYRPLFPFMGHVKSWDVENGDAMVMAGVEDSIYDFVHSSHCLEHLKDPILAIKHWVRICRPGGHIIIIIPDENLYEQGVWPSTFNTDHKWSFTIGKTESWSPVSLNVINVIKPVLDQIDILKIELLDSNYFYGLHRFDQTQTLTGESAIEIVLRKR